MFYKIFCLYLQYQTNLNKLDMEKLNIGSRVKISNSYGGKKGIVEEIVGSFVIVKIGRYTESFHESDVTEI